MHLAVAAIILDVNDTGDFESDEPDHPSPAQEAGAERTAPGYLALLSTFDNRRARRSERSRARSLRG
jgi:hypothetical protein